MNFGFYGREFGGELRILLGRGGQVAVPTHGCRSQLRSFLFYFWWVGPTWKVELYENLQGLGAKEDP